MRNCTIIEAVAGRITVRSHRTGRIRTYRCYRDGHWEMVHGGQA